jgi:integrase/recombinase XerD
MATIKIELFTSKTLADGRHPIYITVRHNKAVRRKAVGSAFPHEWDKDRQMIKPKGRKDHVADTIHIENEFEKYKAIFRILDRSDKPWRAEDVFNYQVKQDDGPTTFYKAAESYLASLEYGSISYDGVKARFDKVKRYAKTDFSIDEINDRWITGFIKHCKTREKNKAGNMGNSKNTINHAFRFIKRVVSFAEVENKSLKRVKIFDDKNVRGKLTAEEIKLLEHVHLTPGTLMYHARNIFLVQFYFRGMRIGDALRLQESDLISGRLKYDANKTGVGYDMKIVAPCQKILDQYTGHGRHYIFPFLRLKEEPDNVVDFKNELKNRTMVINRNLKVIAQKCGIDKILTTHIARHSFASIADKQLGGDLKTLQGLFGHSSRKMTEVYIRDLRRNDDLDDAADQVLL